MDNANRCFAARPSDGQDPWTAQDELHTDLLTAKLRVYDPCGFTCTGPIPEKLNADYGAYRFHLDDRPIRFRVAKTTPTKTGQFVTVYKRPGVGPIQPYDESDPMDLLVISSCNGTDLGQFIFPKAVLAEKNILSVNGQGGKRAIRIYPPWDTPASRQAQKTQSWQLNYFLNLSEAGPIDLTRAKALYG